MHVTRGSPQSWRRGYTKLPIISWKCPRKCPPVMWNYSLRIIFDKWIRIWIFEDLLIHVLTKIPYLEYPPELAMRDITMFLYLDRFLSFISFICFVAFYFLTWAHEQHWESRESVPCSWVPGWSVVVVQCCPTWRHTQRSRGEAVGRSSSGGYGRCEGSAWWAGLEIDALLTSGQCTVRPCAIHQRHRLKSTH